MKDKRSKILNIIAPLISVACLLALWCVVSLLVDSEYILPDLITTLKSFVKLFSFQEFFVALTGTLTRTLIAFALSFLVAFALSLLSKKWNFAKKFISPIIMIIRVLPTVAVVLLLLFWTNSNVAPVIVTMLVVLPTTFTGITNALNSVDEKQIEMCKSFGVSEKVVFSKVQLPQIMPELLVVVGSGVSLNLKLMVASEVLSQTARSMGHLMNNAKVYFEISTMIALVLVTIVLGIIIESVFNLLSKKVSKWKK